MPYYLIIPLLHPPSPLSHSPPTTPPSRLPFNLHLPLTITHNPSSSAGVLCLGTAGIIVTLISVGGLTRLTKSGLSMVHWSPTKLSPPQTQSEWEAEFQIYKTYPEWQQRMSMTLDDFKYIFYWEWGHRILGRVVGTVYGGGLMALAATGRIPKVGNGAKRWEDRSGWMTGGANRRPRTAQHYN